MSCFHRKEGWKLKEKELSLINEMIKVANRLLNPDRISLLLWIDLLRSS
jgi:hypothetical protein